MTEIPLTMGKVALVDDADVAIVSPYKWHAYKHRNSFYARATARGIVGSPKIHMHRLILGLTDPKVQVDHKDRDGLNNQRSNLRVCSHRQNQGNVRKRNGNHTSQYRGVHFHAGKWSANISINKKRTYLGRFASERDAALAYDAAAIKHFGEFANLNFPALASLSGERR